MTNFRLQSAAEGGNKTGREWRRGSKEKWINSGGAPPNFHFPLFHYLFIRLEERVGGIFPAPRRNRPRFTPSEGGGDEARVHLGNVFSNRHLDRATKLVTRTPFIVGRGRISAGETFPRRNFAVHLHAVPESLHFISVQVYK